MHGALVDDKEELISLYKWNSKEKSFDLRFPDMIKGFSEELSTIDKVDFAAIEAAIFIQNPKATIAIANVVGAVWGFLLKEDISTTIIDNRRWKKIIVGKGNANKDFIKNSEYPFAFLKSRYIRKTKRKRVSKNTYRNTVIALENQKEHGSIGGKLQDARVVAFKEPPKGSKWKNGGIYREVPMRAKNKKTGAKKFKFEPLFIFKKTPRQAGKVTFSQRIKKIADKRVFKYWVSETRKLARKRK